MELYLSDLLSSAVPFPAWGIFLLWALLFVGSNALFLKSRTLMRGQRHLRVADSPVSITFSSRLLLGQLAFAALVFLAASLVSPWGFVLIAGGWVVVTAVTAALNLRSLLFFTAIARPDAAQGSVTLSPELALRDQAFHLLVAAFLCLLLGVLVAHLALLGGALFLGAASGGYMKRARAAARRT